MTLVKYNGWSFQFIVYYDIISQYMVAIFSILVL